ncbi:MAG: TonB-dependent receptor [Chitinophagales bacterium]
MKQIYVLFTLLCFFLLTNKSFAQQEFTGTIIDSDTKEALVGVNILVKDTKIGTVTDLDGNFELQIKLPATVVFKYVGYKTETRILTSDSAKKINISLKTDSYDFNAAVISASRRKEKILDAPASISIIEAKSIKAKVAIGVSDMVQDISGVDVMKTGLQGSNVVVRGFNGLFSNDLLSLVDNRIARVPSLRSNAFQMIATTDDDIEKIEVLRGPASALYGPNSSSGVMHIITKSPIDHQGTVVNFGFGLRSQIKDTIQLTSATTPKFDEKAWSDRAVSKVSIRHADRLTFKDNPIQVGYKISAAYMQGSDWKYNDPAEPDSIVKAIQSPNGNIYLYENGQTVSQDSLEQGFLGDYVDNSRNEEIKKYSADGRLDVRFNSRTELVFAAGYNNVSNVEMLPLGASQYINWEYIYGQARLRHKNLFAQIFVNSSNSGDTYFLRTGNLTTDKSKFVGSQIQHSIEPSDLLKLVYGADAFWTLPNTEGTLNGRYEDSDNIQEYGAYMQADYKVLPKINLIAALRSDYHHFIKRAFVSPRAAIMYKPNANHNLRLTFNRAFKTPGTGAWFIDVKSGEIPTGVDILAKGNLAGYHFQYADNPYFNDDLLPQFRSAFGETTNTYYNVGDASINNEAWQNIIQIVLNEAAANVPEELAALVTTGVGLILPENIEDIGHEVKDLNLTTQSFQLSDWKNVKDLEKANYTETKSYEIGYKGVIGKRFFLTFDAYRTDIKNYLVPTTLVTPSVMLNSSELEAYLTPIIEERLGNVPPAFEETILELLDQNPDFGGNNNGRVDDEIISIMVEASSQLPIGTISPTELDGPAMLITSRNIGDLSVYGFDCNANFYLTQNIKLNASYSFVDKDSILVEGAQFGYIGLNAPQHKVRFGASYNLEKIGLDMGLRFRWNDSYPANSGVFVGRVATRHELDVNVSWTPNFYKAVNMTLTVQNAYNNATQYFVGTPEIGRLSMLRVSHRF